MDSERVIAEVEEQVEAIAVVETAAQPESAESVSESTEVLPAEKPEETSKPSTLEDLKTGMRIKGKVRNMVDFGAFVDIGVGRDGLAHISTLKRAGIDKTLKVGDELDVQVRRIDTENNRISLTVPGASKGDKKSLAKLAAGEMVSGRVVRLVDFGAFVDIGAQTDGLLHISQLPGGYVRHPSDVVRVGEQVQVRILEVDTAKRRISLSMKESRQRQSKNVAQLPQQQEDGNHGPTTFQVAWEEALAK